MDEEMKPRILNELLNRPFGKVMLVPSSQMRKSQATNLRQMKRSEKDKKYELEGERKEQT